jgi:branched chain amino acid efflux pump
MTPHDMTPNDGFGVLAAILVMAIATYAMRAGGFWLMALVPLTPRLRRMIEALPGSVVVAAVLPFIVREGPVAALAIAVAGAVVLVTRKDILAVLAGMAVAAAVRAVGW